MSLEYISRHDIAPDEWDAVVKGSPDGWVFGLYGWQELTLAVPNWAYQDFSFGIREGGKLLAVVPLQYQAASRTMASNGWSGCGPMVSGALAGKFRSRVMQLAIDRCLGLARQQGAEAFSFTLNPVTQTSLSAPWGVNPFAQHGLDDTAGLSQVVDLRVTPDALWFSLSQDARRQVRAAREAGITVSRVEWSECLDDYYALHCATYARTGVQPHPESYFSGIVKHIAPGGHAVLWRAQSADGATLAYHNACWFKQGGYYHTGCSADGANELGASYLLFWEALAGAQAGGLQWYDCGAIFPNATDPKQKGLSTFKTKFGGEAHRRYVCRWPIQPSAPAQASAEENLRRAYEAGNIYKADTVCNQLKKNSAEYNDRLLAEKLDTVRRHARPGLLVDLCCATGDHLFELSDVSDQCLGIDFSRPFIDRAREKAGRLGLKHVRFEVGNAKAMQLESSSVTTLYSLSALYQIPGIHEVFSEVARVLQAGGRCVLDLGNIRSLNAISVRAYTELPPSFHLTVAEMQRLCASNGLRIIEHRRFQLLPLWSDKPRWLYPLLHPVWKKIMSKRIKGRMLDEWLCAAPVLRSFAFRHLIVCEKI